MSLLFCEKEDLLQSGFLLEYLPCIVSKNGPKIMIAARAQTRSQRRSGLLEFEGLPEGVALVIDGAPLLHNFGMKFPLDVIWLRNNKIVKIVSRWSPRLPFVKGAWAWTCLEMRSGEASRLGLAVGDRISIVEAR